MRVRICKSLRFVTAASKDWDLGFGLVTAGRERAKRDPRWLPPQTLNPNLCERAKEHASRAGGHGKEEGREGGSGGEGT